MTVHRPSSLPKERRDAPAAVAPILRGQRDDVRGQRLLVRMPARHLPLGRTVQECRRARDIFWDSKSPQWMHERNQFLSLMVLRRYLKLAIA